MKILVTGANGFLGQHLCRFLKDDYEVVGTGRGVKRIPFSDVHYLDTNIREATDVERMAANISPDVIIHSAAMSKPDECDVQRALCTEINVHATKHLVDAASDLAKPVHFIYISSDFVLGEGGPHAEDATPAPLNFYGQTKLEAETVVANSGLFYTIIRPVFMYGEIWEGIRGTFLHWVKESLEQRKKIKVVADQQRTPTYVGDICRGIASVIRRRAGGLYHLSGDEILSPFNMASILALHLKLDASLVEPVTADTFPEPVQRTKNGGAQNGKAKAELGYVATSYFEGLNRTFPEHPLE